MEALPIAFLFLLFTTAAGAAASGLNFEIVDFHLCDRNSSSPLSSAFSDTLTSVLEDFNSLASAGTKNYSHTPSDADGAPLYAFFQCRGDLSTASCSACTQNATASLPQTCPIAVGARLALDGCFLRYDNQSFFDLDASWVEYLCNTQSTSANLPLATLAYLWANLTTDAPNKGGFAMATLSGVYGMADCYAYLNQSECSNCLTAIKYNSLCPNTTGISLFQGSCASRFELYNFLEAPELPTASTPPPSGSKRKIVIILTVTFSIGVFIVIGVLLYWRYKTRRYKAKEGWRREILQSKGELFSLKELEEATNRFDPANELGKGGFGIVYKGTLSNGKQVAIKKLRAERDQGQAEFLNEVNLITSVQHKNLITLLGCCVEGHERILVYEYLQNKSLDFFLFGKNAKTLDWPTRYNIVTGIARGLAYLHEESHNRIIHRDIKPNNILLDDDLSPVIADFGVARLVKENATHVHTGLVGTIGYLSPEYALHGILSEKVDVFSFGLVTLEILTGLKNVHSHLLTGVWEKYEDGNVLDIVDERLGGDFSAQEVIRLVHIALLCTQQDPKRRPTMSTVVHWVSSTSDIPEKPIRPSLLIQSSMSPTASFNLHSDSMPSNSSRVLISDRIMSSYDISAAR